jgi:hypothetical protein
MDQLQLAQAVDDALSTIEASANSPERPRSLFQGAPMMLACDWYLRWVFKPVRKKAVPADQAEAFVAGKTLKMATAAAIGMPCFLIGVTAIILVHNGMETNALGRFFIVLLNAAWVLSLWFIGCARAALVHLTIHVERYGLSARQKCKAPTLADPAKLRPAPRWPSLISQSSKAEPSFSLASSPGLDFMQAGIQAWIRAEFPDRTDVAGLGPAQKPSRT